MLFQNKGGIDIGRKAVDLTGKRFGRRVVIKRVPPREYDKNSRWLCKCDCGRICEVLSHTLPRTISCGCYAVERTKITAKKRAESIDTHTRSLQKLNDKRAAGNNVARGVSKRQYTKGENTYTGYIAYISLDKNFYYLVQSQDPRFAIKVRRTAEKHAKDGTFHEWFKMWKNEKNTRLLDM